MSILVLGVDGARAGWVVAVAQLGVIPGATPHAALRRRPGTDPALAAVAAPTTATVVGPGSAPASAAADPGSAGMTRPGDFGPVVTITLHLVPNFNEVLARWPEAAAIAVDMPIGLPDRAVTGGRLCERLARARLGPRRPSVFSAPSRPALAGGTYPAALMLNREGGGPGLSKQAYNLFPRLREVDAVMTPQLQIRVRETHPELAFALLAGAPMAHPKRTADGRAERLAALGRAGWPTGSVEPHPFARKDAAPDDALDALVLAWTAARIAAGSALRLPEAPERDARGLAMEMWA